MQDFCGSRDVLGHGYQETEIETFPFCSNIIQFSRLALARASRSGKENNPGYHQGRFLRPQINTNPTEQDCPEVRQLHLSWGRQNHSMCPAPHGNAPHPAPLLGGMSAEGQGEVHVPSPHSLHRKHLLSYRNPHVQYECSLPNGMGLEMLDGL